MLSPNSALALTPEAEVALLAQCYAVILADIRHTRAARAQREAEKRSEAAEATLRTTTDQTPTTGASHD
jgi:hypothetical protein